MTLQAPQIRLIGEWFRAAKEGRTLVLTIKGSGAEAAKARIQEIQAMNPSLFPKEA